MEEMADVNNNSIIKIKPRIVLGQKTPLQPKSVDHAYHDHGGDVRYNVTEERVSHTRHRGRGKGGRREGDNYSDEEEEDGDDYKYTHHHKRRKSVGVVNSHHNDWAGGYMCWGVGLVVFFFFMFVIIGSAGYKRSPYYYGGGGHPPHPLQVIGKDTRGKGECSVGESFYSEYNQCLPRQLHPLAVDRSIQDHNVSVCEDFETYSCGKWANDPAHDGESRSFSYIEKQNQFDVRSIIMDPSVEAVHSFYRSCVDTLVDGKHRVETLQERTHEMERILGSFKSTGDLPDIFGRLMRNAYTAPVAIQIENHPLKPKLIPMIRFDGFPADLDDDTIMNLFMSNTETRFEARGKMKILKKVLGDVEKGRPGEIDDYISYVKGDGLKNDIMSWADFKKTAFGGKFLWDRLLQRLDGHQLRFNEDQEVWVVGREHFKSVDFKTLSYAEWRVYIEFSVLYHTESFFPDLPSNVFYRTAHPLRMNYRYAKMDRFHRTRNATKNRSHTKGAPSIGISYNDCVKATQFLLPGLVSKEFLRRGFHDEKALDRVKQVVEDVKSELADMQMTTPYIDMKTRVAIANKTRAITVRVAHPTRWSAEPFSASITSDRYLRNLDMIREYRVQRDLELWKNNGQLDRDEAARFQGPLSTTNAWYSPTYNVITIYPGILRYPFFHAKFNDASMFAGIGMVAGHELGHNGDSNGVLFDGEGSVRDLWSPKSEDQLHKHFVCIEKEYENTPPESCKKEGYGKQVLGEAAADRTGIEVAYRAWEKRLPGKKATRLQAKEFFESYAQTWCSSYSIEQACDRVDTDVHPLARQRVMKTLRNFPKFQEAYNCKNTDPMVHKPSCVVYGKEAKIISQ